MECNGRMVVVGLALAAFLVNGCSDKKSEKTELERQRELAQAVLQEMKVDLTAPVVASTEHKFKDESELTQICDEFMGHFGQGELDNAFDLLDKHTPWPRAEMKVIRDNTKTQIQSVSARFGRFRGHEKVKVEQIGTSLVRFQYLAKLENQALRCTFLFYRTDDRWTLNLFMWDDKIYMMDP